jgi:hypothetical protein
MHKAETLASCLKWDYTLNTDYATNVTMGTGEQICYQTQNSLEETEFQRHKEKELMTKKLTFGTALCSYTKRKKEIEQENGD